MPRLRASDVCVCGMQEAHAHGVRVCFVCILTSGVLRVRFMCRGCIYALYGFVCMHNVRSRNWGEMLMCVRASAKYGNDFDTGNTGFTFICRLS